ncbi:GDSL-type esterase/lipase family protein [Desulfoscipio gibsoniae]|uniref:Lysophospholipase L1-like esterase n=1 Tax=Desulfoscipio gibsoniae DSM 7213 TaxID=767817 RepID=R4KGW4_9FIRM|nr:GDSL-type esterase/lipase family protein [Desulfoscipio gibsoniae]AGL01849.1 lysophospholipase L1-like esterase [Desulfoscipio gibsoniae DSM 7213]
MTNTIICLGDSITFGYPLGPEFSWVNHLYRRTGINLVNRGVNGDTTLDMLRRYERYVPASKVTHVHILGGANDAWMGLDMAATKRNIQEMVKLSRQQGIIPMLGLVTPLTSDPIEGGTFLPFGMEAMVSWLARYRNWLSDYAVSESIMLIDYYTPLCIPGTGQGDGQYFYDECHLNDKGYMLMAEIAERAVLKLL